MNSTAIIIGIIGIALSGAVMAWLLWESRPIEPDEDSGPDYDANVRHICWQCGKHLSGPAQGLELKDQLCWDCYCARTPRDDSPAVPSYVSAHK